MATTEAPRVTDALSPLVVSVPLADIFPSDMNPRTHVDAEALQELADSIKTYGLLEPIVVRPRPAKDHTYEIIAGERRYRACALAGLPSAPVRILHDIDTPTALKLALIENLQRKDLDPIDEAEGYRRLRDELDMSQQQIADAANRSQPAIAKALSLLSLPAELQDLIRSGDLTVGHTVTLLKYRAYPEAMAAMARHVIRNRVATRDLEKGIPNAAELESAGLALNLTSYGTPFYETCRTCPFNAVFPRADWPGATMCLNSAHHAALKRAHTEAEAARAAAALAATQQTGKAIDLSTLTREQYTPIGSYNRPGGCTDDCPCRAAGVAHGRATLICTDPRRYRQLKARDTRLANQERQRRAEHAYSHLTGHVDSLQEITPRAMALVSAYALHNLAVPIIKATSKRAGHEIPTNKYQLPLEAQTFNALAALTPLQQLQIVLDAIMRSEIAAISTPYERHDAFDWYTDISAPAKDASA